jgi:hypothetical protein
MQLDEVSKQINEFIVGCPANKNKFCKHIKKVIRKAEEYGQYLRAEWQKAKKAGLTQYDENKDKEKWFWWTALSNDWMWGKLVYFANIFEDDVYVGFYTEGKPKQDPLAYLRNMIWGSVGQVYEGLELLDYQFVLLAIIYDAQNWQAGRERIYFNKLRKETLSDRLCGAVWEHLEGYNGQGSGDIRQTIETALANVKADLASKQKKRTEQPKKQTSNLPQDVRGILAYMWPLDQDVKEYPFLNKGRDIRLTFQQQELFKRIAIFSLSDLRVCLISKCNIQSPDDLSVFQMLKALELTYSVQIHTDYGEKAEPQAGTGDKAKPAAADAYITFNEALEFSGGVITRRILLKAIRKGYPVKVRSDKPSSQRMCVHIQDVLVLVRKLSPGKDAEEKAAKMFGQYKDELVKKQQNQQNLD